MALFYKSSRPAATAFDSTARSKSIDSSRAKSTRPSLMEPTGPMDALLPTMASLGQVSVQMMEQSVIAAALDSCEHRFPSSAPQVIPGIFRNLETLELQSDRTYRFAIHTLNDAMWTFASTLRTVKLMVDQSYRYCSDPSSMEKSRKALQLKDNLWTNSVGEWSVPLSRLTHLELDLVRIAGIGIGSFRQCPNLELELSDTAAMRFDFESLEEMDRLETLVLSMSAEASQLHSLQAHKEHQKRSLQEKRRAMKSFKTGRRLR
ncbi:hypothetical protein BGZ54_008971 [Gamsiella multidivaricata]|nr:hypothetical protein BGZ54_008971 [Gamsiella multidivaricata]